ncbi:unnamed protein product, partial [Brenthis ino]
MEFRETLLAAQRNQQEKSSDRTFYKARFDPPKKEQKCRDRLSANIQKFLAKKEEEERQKKLEAQRKREELSAMRDPKALRKIQKTLKVIKSANKSVLADAMDREHTAVTREGPDQPDQDDYGYESQEAAALYQKMMQKYSKVPDEPKFAPGGNYVSKDINGTRERVKHALQHEDDPVPHKRRRRTENGERELTPPTKYEPERKKDEKSEKPKIRKPAPPPMDFNQLLKLAEQKKSEPIEIATKKVVAEPEPDRLMTKKQKREYEEEMARRQRRQERIEAAKAGRKVPREEKSDKPDKEKRVEPSSFGRIPKLTDKNSYKEFTKSDSPKTYEREKDRSTQDRDRERLQREKERMRLDKERFDREKERYDREKERYDREKERFDKEKEKSRLEKEKHEKEKYEREKEKSEREKERLDRERLDKLKAERDRIDREMERLNRDRERLDKTKIKLENKSSDRMREKIVDRSKTGSKDREVKKSIDLKSQNTYRIDKNSNEKKLIPQKSIDPKMNGHSKPVPKLNKDTKEVTKKPIENSKLNGNIKDKRLLESKLQQKRADDKRPLQKPSAGPSKPVMSNSFDFDKHVNSLGKNGSKQYPPGDVKRRAQDDRRNKKRRPLDSDSEYDSEMDDFIDDADENLDYSRHIKEIFGYDKSKYRDMDDDDDPMMESSFARQQREEYISKKIGIMEDLEDMRMEAMQKSKNKKRRRLSDD